MIAGLYLTFIFIFLTSVNSNCTTQSSEVVNKSNNFTVKTNEIDNENTNDTTIKPKRAKTVEYVPVTLDHPLFKVFGINPKDYVVYYRYKYDTSDEYDTEPLPVHKLDKILAKTIHRSKKPKTQIIRNNNLNLPLRKIKSDLETRTRRKVEKAFSGENYFDDLPMLPVSYLRKKYFYC